MRGDELNYIMEAEETYMLTPYGYMSSIFDADKAKMLMKSMYEYMKKWDVMP